MLPAASRLTRREDFTAVVRRGRRAGWGAAGGTLVVHRLAAEDAGARLLPPRVGLVVGRGVGNAARRHEVSRRLRHLMRSRLPRLEPGDRLVIRANAAAAGRSSAELGDDIDRALPRLGLTAPEACR